MVPTIQVNRNENKDIPMDGFSTTDSSEVDTSKAFSDGDPKPSITEARETNLD